MTRLTALIATLIACAVVHADDKKKLSEVEEQAKSEATADYVKAYPPKAFFISSTGNKRVQMIAEKGITILPDGKVIGVDASEGLPHTIWLFRGAATEARCEFVNHPEATRDAEIAEVMKSFARASERARGLAPGVAKRFLSHLRCIAETALIDSPRFSVMITTPEYLVTYASPDYSGSALFLAQYDGLRLDILSARLPPPSNDESKPK